MKVILIMAIFLNQTLAQCEPTTKLSCVNFTQDACQTVPNYACSWDYSKISCTNSTGYARKFCVDLKFEEDCLYNSAQKCSWDGQRTDISSQDYQSIASTNMNGKCVQAQCKYFKSQIECNSFENISCEWQDSQCVEVNECGKFKTVHGCRTSRLRKRCVVLKDGQVLPISQRDIYFGTFSCVVYECKHQIYADACTFVNGDQCFYGTDGCRKCNDFSQSDTCINTKFCTWQNNGCEFIQCQELLSKQLCSQYSTQCEWNQQSMSCKLNSSLLNKHCYTEYNPNMGQIIQFLLVIMIMIL